MEHQREELAIDTDGRFEAMEKRQIPLRNKEIPRELPYIYIYILIFIYILGLRPLSSRFPHV